MGHITLSRSVCRLLIKSYGSGHIDDRPMKDGLRRILGLESLLVTYSMSLRDRLSLRTEVLCDHQAERPRKLTGTMDEREVIVVIWQGRLQ